MGWWGGAVLGRVCGLISIIPDAFGFDKAARHPSQLRAFFFWRISISPSFLRFCASFVCFFCASSFAQFLPPTIRPRRIRQAARRHQPRSQLRARSQSRPAGWRATHTARGACSHARAKAGSEAVGPARQGEMGKWRCSNGTNGSVRAFVSSDEWGLRDKWEKTHGLSCVRLAETCCLASGLGA